jgi:uncharacterized protein (TIRG00374 family)
VRYLRAGLWLLGLALLGVLIAENDPPALLASITRLSWRFGILLVFPMTLVTLFDTLGWRFAFARDLVSFGALVSARLAGEAFNMTTPTAAMGGEAVKAWLLRDRAPLDVTLPSVIVAKTTITIGQGLLLLLGVILAWSASVPPSPLLRAMQWLTVIELLALAAFVLVQTRGMLAWSGWLLTRLGLPTRRTAALGRVDEVLGRFYRGQPGRLTLSIAFHLVAWLLGAVEAYLILHFVGVEVSLLTATVIEAFGTAIRFATFMIPGSVGVLEGGYAATFVALGLSAPLGVSFSLIRRVRELVWIGIGLLVFALMRPRPASPVASAPSGRRL